MASSILRLNVFSEDKWLSFMSCWLIVDAPARMSLLYIRNRRAYYALYQSPGACKRTSSAAINAFLTASGILSMLIYMRFSLIFQYADLVAVLVVHYERPVAV